MAELLTGGEIIAEFLIRAGIPYVVGIPGHGNLPLVDAFRKRRKDIGVIQVKQEMCGVHLAEGHYRVGGTPLAVFTSIGPGAVNTAIGVANAYVDSMPVMILTGNAHTHMAGKGVLQEIERTHSANFPRILEPITKRYWQVNHVSQLPHVLHRAYNVMMTGRPGPVLIDLPMDVQAEATQVSMPDLRERMPRGKVEGDREEVIRAAQILADAQRPVILAGGGAIAAEAWHEIRGIAEHLGAAVVTTMMGKSVFPEDHPLYAWCAGSKGTTCGNKLCATADVILAIGCRFADETTSSYRPGVSFAIPPTRLIQVDMDPGQIGKNYPVTSGIVGHAQAVCRAMLDHLRAEVKQVYYEDSKYFHEIQRLKVQWEKALRTHRKDTKVPVMISTLLQEIRKFLDRDAIVVTSSGNVQAQVLQEFPFYEPKTHISTGGFSTMGFGLPAAIGAKLAAPDRQVMAIVGDGDFMMTMQELSTAMQLRVPVVAVVANNMGWQAITDLQLAAYGKDKSYATEFLDANDKPYSPDFAAIAKAFGCFSIKASRRLEIAPALKRAFAAKRPAVVEVKVNREYPDSGSPAVGWWDVPVPPYIKDKRQRYERDKADEELT